MKLKLFLIAASAMALASCSSDEVVQSNEDANAIKFSVVANNGSRAADSWCNYKLPTQFNVWAAVGGKNYFAGESYSKQGDVWAIDGGNHRYWPASGTNVSFYAAKIKAEDVAKTEFAKFNWNIAADGVTVNAPTISMTTNAEASKQNDLLYAYTEKSRPASGGKVEINFRHALSQIVFYAQNLNENVYVTIDEVKICNIKSKGIFSFGTATTDDKVQDHDQKGDLDAVSTSVGSWEVTNLGDYGDQVLYNVTTDNFGQVAVSQAATKTTAVPLTENTDNNSASRDFAHSLLLIPQTVTAWNPTSIKDPDGAGQNGAYFMVKCNIQNVAAGNGTVATKDDVCLWGTKTVGGDPATVTLGTQYIYLPVNITWQTGRKYIYTFKFMGDGHGGYTDGGDPVLIPITFDVDVDDFAEETDAPIYIDNAPKP